MLCRRELPALVALYRKYEEQGFKVLYVNSKHDTLAKVKRFSKYNPLPFPILLDPKGEVATIFGMRWTPYHVLYDAQGKQISTSSRLPKAEVEEMMANVDS